MSKNTMDAAFREKLETLAWERLRATTDDNEKWSFLFTDGSVSLSYCPWAEMDAYEFDGSIHGLELPWTKERIVILESGKLDPTVEELLQWRHAKCQALAESGEAWITWIVPLILGDQVGGYVVFLFHSSGAPEDEPILEGIFDTIEEAKSALSEQGFLVP